MARKMIAKKLKQRVYVAMSGGVDSSVAAALLKKEGYKVTGVFFKPWQPISGHRKSRTTCDVVHCGWEQDRRDAMSVAEVLGIPFKTWDFSQEYKNKVGDYMIESYRHGITPNPDVMCNKEIKFGLFLKKALKEGADFIATGHYVRKAQVKSSSSYKVIKLNSKHFKLLTARDKNKDQSYFLWTLTQEQLKHCLFPIGDYKKPEVRKLAKKFSLPTFNKKDSQGVCFVGQLDMKEFLNKYIPSKPGKIILRGSGEQSFLFRFSQKTVPTPPLDEIVVGTHDGAAFYTIGQRHGLNITDGGGPYYVSGKDIKKNLVFVTKDEKQLGAKEITVSNPNWINSKVIHMQGLALQGLKIKARYRAPAVSVKVIHMQGLALQRLKIRTIKPIRAVSPGQAVVFYKGQEVLGGGIIT